MAHSAVYAKICAASPVKSGEPFGWIQWKGTNVCMDVHCECGEMLHLDAEYAYTIQCALCKRIYAPDASVKLIELTPQESADYNDSGPCVCMA